MAHTLDWEEIFSPVQDLFSTSQVQMLLLAWLPLKFGEYFQTGIHAIDMFMVTVVASVITAFLSAGFSFSKNIQEWFNFRNGNLSLQIDYYRAGPWGEIVQNKYYAAAAWMISNGASGLDSGSFLVIPEAGYDDDEKMLAFDVLPNKMSYCNISYKGQEYSICFQDVPEVKKKDNGEDNSKVKTLPSIIISPKKAQPVSWCKEFLEDLGKEFREYERSKKERGRYDFNDYWFHVLDLHPNLGLKSVALDEDQERQLKRDLNAFVANKDFYAKIGLPYRRGYLFYGKPGTGKTSLIHAIASELNRDIYYLNLKGISTDAELQAAFAEVPRNCVIVFEDIDAMSRVCHKRAPVMANSVFFTATAADTAAEGAAKKENEGSLKATAANLSSTFTLSCLLNCLDGHVMQPGNIVIMTTNHPEVLDPALVRAGRIDLKLELGYTTRYQVMRMYENIVKSSFPDEEKVPELEKEWLDTFVEGVVPPCEVMRDMLLYRLEPLEIPKRVQELVEKYSNGARSAEEEEEENRRMEMAALEAKEAEEKVKKAIERKKEKENDDSDNDDD